MDDLAAKIQAIIAVELQVDRDRVSPSAKLRQDLGMDSVAALNILFAAEETFGLEPIDVSELATVTTVEDVEALVRLRIAMLRAS